MLVVLRHGMPFPVPKPQSTLPGKVNMFPIKYQAKHMYASSLDLK